MSIVPKILMLSTSDINGGAARSAYRIFKSLLDAGVQSKMLVMYKNSKHPDVRSVNEFYKKSVLSEIQRYVKRKIGNKLQHARWNKYKNKENVFMSDLRGEPLNGALQKIEFDILHLNWVNLQFLDLRELVGINKPIVWTLHDCWAFTGICHYFYLCNNYKTECGNCPLLHSSKKTDLSNQIWKKKKDIYNKLNLHIVCTSNWLGASATQSSLLRDFPIHVIHTPIDTEFYSPGEKSEACKTMQLNSSKIYILFCATNALTDSRKGFHELIEALKNLKNKQDNNGYELLIVGAKKPFEEIYSSLPVTYLEEIEDERMMATLFNVADVTVVPSLAENFSNVILESHACGTPVVAFSIGGNSDMIEHKITGYLARSFDATDFAEGIRWCLEENLSGTISQNARKKIVDNFSNRHISAQYLRLYRSLTSET